MPLGPSRPLWIAHLVDGYCDGRVILLRTHHALADGTALVQAAIPPLRTRQRPTHTQVNSGW